MCGVSSILAHQAVYYILYMYNSMYNVYMYNSVIKAYQGVYNIYICIILVLGTSRICTRQVGIYDKEGVSHRL